MKVCGYFHWGLWVVWKKHCSHCVCVDVVCLCMEIFICIYWGKEKGKQLVGFFYHPLLSHNQLSDFWSTFFLSLLLLLLHILNIYFCDQAFSSYVDRKYWEALSAKNMQETDEQQDLESKFSTLETHASKKRWVKQHYFYERCKITRF